MICPRCNADLEVREHAGIRTSTCPRCNGNWIGGTALAILFERDRDAPHIEEALEAILDMDYRNSRRLCPECRGRHLKLLLVDDVELDYCVSCKGLYFDPGELEQVFPAAGKPNPAAGPPPGSASQIWEVILKFTGGSR